MDWLSIIVSLLIASLVLIIFFKFSSIFGNKKEHNSLDSKKKKGKTILITGPIKSGKTFLFQKLINSKKALQSVHSLKPNVAQFGQWKLIDLPLDSRKLHSQPADYFHFNDLAALILCTRSDNSFESVSTGELELLITMTFAIGIFKNIPLCICVFDEGIENDGPIIITKELLLKKLLKTLHSIQLNLLSNLLNHENDQSNPVISFDDPINRLIFESTEGETADYESALRSYFDENVSINTNVQNWIEKTL